MMRRASTIHVIPMTEAAALDKRCPMRMNNPTLNIANCIGTQCMAFRFIENGVEWDNDTGDSIPVRLYHCTAFG